MPLDLDAFIGRHLHTSSVKSKKRLKYETEELQELVTMAIETFQNEGSLVKLNPPCIIVGDIHGQFYDLLRMFSLFSIKTDTEHTSGALAKRFMFVGDYVDRGPQSLECLCLVLALKIRFPKKYQLLRGNHECENINRVYGFLDELVERHGDKEGETLWNKFNDVFSWMPYAGLVGNKILCMHGGISPEIRSLEDIEKIERPLRDATVNPLAMDLLWADPKPNITGYLPNSIRGVSVFFGENEVKRVCQDLNLDLIVRGHQVMISGWGTFANRKLFTIFTAPRYQLDPPNCGAVMIVSEEGRIGITALNVNKTEAGRSGVTDKEKTNSTASKNSSVSKNSSASEGVPKTGGKQKRKKK